MDMAHHQTSSDAATRDFAALAKKTAALLAVLEHAGTLADELRQHTALALLPTANLALDAIQSQAEIASAAARLGGIERATRQALAQ